MSATGTHATRGERRDGLRRMARGGLVNAIGAAVGSVSNVGIVLVITNALDRDDAGVFFTLTSLVLIAAAVSRLGTPTGLVYFIAGQRADCRPGLERHILALALRPVMVLAMLLAVALIALAPAILAALNISESGNLTQLRVLALFVPVAVYAEVVLSATRGMGRMRPTVVIDRIGRSALQFVLVCAAAATGQMFALAVAWSLPYLPSAVLAWRRFRSDTARADRADPRLASGTFWAFTASRAVTSVIQIALQRADILLVAALLGPAEAAVYTAASRFLVLGQLAGQAVSLAAQPQLAAALTMRQDDKARELYKTATGWLILLGWPLYLSSMHLADQMLDLFGPRYGTGHDVVLVLAVAMLVATGCGMVDVVLNMAGRTSWNLVNNVVALVVNVAVDVVLIPRIGIVGAAVGWAAAIAVNNVLPLVQLTVYLRIHPFGRGTGLSMLISALCLGLFPLLVNGIAGGEAEATGTGVVTGGLLMLIVCFALRRPLALDLLFSATRARPGKVAP